MSNKIVIYFSATETTKEASLKLAKLLNCESYEIKPVKKYTNADLNYQDSSSRATLEAKDPNIKVDFIKDFKGLDKYDTIYLGFPIWWYQEPRIIDTFLNSYDFSNKNIVIFATSGGSSLDSTFEAIKKNHPNLRFEKGLVVNRVSDEEIENWLN